MDIQYIMNINVNTLSAEQFKELKKFTIYRLKQMLGFIENDQFDNALTLLSDSPSGDGYGEDNSYINFSIEGTDIEDIGDVLRELHKLKSFLQKG